MTIGCAEPLETLVLDAGSMYSNWGCLYYMLIYDNLMKFTKPPNYYKFTPELAASYDLAEDRMSYVLHIAEGAKWHDGKPLTAEDVKFSMEQLWSLPTWADAEVDYESIEIIDDHTLRVNSNLLVSGANLPRIGRGTRLYRNIFSRKQERISRPGRLKMPSARGPSS